MRVDRLDKLLNLAGELAVGRQAQTTHLQTLGEITTLIGQQERMLLALERELKQLRFSPTQRESLDRHMNGALNAGDQASKLIRAHAERFEQHTSQTDTAGRRPGARGHGRAAAADLHAASPTCRAPCASWPAKPAKRSS